jgi:hypothetical protein
VQALERDFDSGIASASVSILVVDLNKDIPQPDIDLLGLLVSVNPKDALLPSHPVPVDVNVTPTDYYSFVGRAPPLTFLITS